MLVGKNKMICSLFDFCPLPAQCSRHGGGALVTLTIILRLKPGQIQNQE